MLEKMGFPDPDALREFIINTPWGVNNRRPMTYLRHLSAQGKSSPLLALGPLQPFTFRVERGLLDLEGSDWAY